MADEDKVILCEYAGSEYRPGGRLRSVAAAVIMMAVLVFLVRFMHSRNGPFLYVVSGRLFQGTFDTVHAGFVLDQPTIGKWYFWSTVFAGLTLPCIAAARWLSDRRGRVGYWAFALTAGAVCGYLAIMLTVPFFWLLQYIRDMGFTPRRIQGLVYGLGGYGVLLGFLRWAVRMPDGQGKARVAERHASSI